MKLLLSITVILLLFASCKQTQNDVRKKSTLLFEDVGTENWNEKWMLDGQRSKVINSEEGMELIAGPEYGNDTCHTVLWTKQSFEGNICIEYDYTRTDTATRCVNILYFHATGRGDESHPTDIAEWNDKRVVPHMFTYFNNMNAYHISFAAFSAKTYSGNNDYIRMRRYNPHKVGLKGTEIEGEHFNTGMFKTNVSYHIEVYRINEKVEMYITNIQNPEEQKIYKWDVSTFPLCESGRIGLRHMYTRSARYKNFRVWQLK